ncbi:sugar kinase [Bradyrhizobium sp. Tv2a-2]|uniref:sugar kinase n=1 Tax=Bradyrhizobium sp. Tv2a-2 TaxID=113395 RepID=UPI000407B567|nr:sugar kinase [Bradyrhizobium sp. Tv2a-2]
MAQAPAIGWDAFAARAAGARIICLGLSALDEVWQVEKPFAGGSEKIRAVEYTTTGGGMAANAAVAVARLGGRPAFWGRGGDDPAGHEMREGLSREGIEVSHFRLFAGGRSSVSGVIVDHTGERQIVNFRGRFPSEADWLPLDKIAGSAAVLADPRWVEGAVALFSRARLLGIPTILDADMAERDVFEQLLPLADHAIFSQPALKNFVGTANDAALRSLTRFNCRVVAVTRGHEGVSYVEDGRLRELPAIAVEAIDTTGAGDVFHGAYAFAIGGGLTVNEAMTFASAAASLKCTRTGGRAAIPVVDDCLAFMRTKR